MELIFDFDGTLVDSFHCLIKRFNELAEKFDFHYIRPDEIHIIRDMDSLSLLKHLRIPILKVPSVIKQIRTTLRNDISQLQPVTGVIPVLIDLYNNGHTLGIVTSNSQENVSAWLKQHQLQSVFQYISSEYKLGSKGSLLKRIIETQQLTKTQTFYIGDESRDIVAAKQNDINAVAVTWGYNSEAALRKCGPHFIMHKPIDLLTLN